MIDAKPIMTPIALLLKSRKVIVSACALLLNLLVTAVPELEPYRGELMVVITGLALALIGGISYEDAAKTAKEATVRAAKTDKELFQALLGDLIDSVSENYDGQTVITLKK
jgi:hypothetical protein